MPVSSLKNWLKNLITEEINKDQLASVANALKIRPDVLKGWVLKTDPTPNQGYSVWLLRGLKKQFIRMEDGPRAKSALERFIQLRNAGRIGDIMQFPHINDLETAIEQLAGQGARRQGFSGVDPSTLPGVEIAQDNPEKDVIMYKVTDPKSLAVMGEGTKWCTRLSYGNGDYHMAESYLKRLGHIFVVYKEGKPYLQFNPDYSQVMDVNDITWKGSSDELGGLELPPPNVPPPKFFDPEGREQQAYEKWANLTGKKIDVPLPKALANPNQYSLTLKGEEPKEIQLLRRWGKLTGNPITLPPRDAEFNARFVKRLAKSIKNSNSFGSIIRPMQGFLWYAKENKTRVPEVEKEILNKNWKKIEFRYFGGGGKMRHLPGMFEIVQYVKDVIKGNWPEFEQKIQDDVFNSVYYYTKTGLSPDFITNQNTKDFVMLIKHIQNKNPVIKTKEFEKKLKEFLLKAKKEYNRGTMQQVIDHILVPYVRVTGRSLINILGKDYRKSFYKGDQDVGVKYKANLNDPDEDPYEDNPLAGIPDVDDI
jgi:hypothetical protein